MSCTVCCFSDFVSCNVDEIEMKAKLMPSKSYKYYVKDRFGRIYSKNFNTDEDGYWELQKSDFPEGFFGAHNRFTLEVRDEDGLAVNMMVQQEYDCIEVEFKQIHSEEPKKQIGADF